MYGNRINRSEIEAVCAQQLSSELFCFLTSLNSWCIKSGESDGL